MLRRTLFAALAVSCLAISCKKEKTTTTPPVADKANVNMTFNTHVDGQGIQANQLVYTNKAGEKYSISTLMYYVSNITLKNTAGGSVKLKNYELINAFDPATKSFVLADVPNGNYNEIQFYLGIDQEQNHNGAQEGDLDPIHGMIWTWQTGYVFFKHEGNFTPAGSSAIEGLSYHFATDKALTTINLPVTLSVSGSNRAVTIDFDLNKLYSAVNTIKFENNNLHHSDQAGDAGWLLEMGANFKKSFTVGSVN
jgi:hypothetical protein